MRLIHHFHLHPYSYRDVTLLSGIRTGPSVAAVALPFRFSALPYELQGEIAECATPSSRLALRCVNRRLNRLVSSRFMPPLRLLRRDHRWDYIGQLLEFLAGPVPTNFTELVISLKEDEAPGASASMSDVFFLLSACVEKIARGAKIRKLRLEIDECSPGNQIQGAFVQFVGVLSNHLTHLRHLQFRVRLTSVDAESQLTSMLIGSLSDRLEEVLYHPTDDIGPAVFTSLAALQHLRSLCVEYRGVEIPIDIHEFYPGSWPSRLTHLVLRGRLRHEGLEISHLIAMLSATAETLVTLHLLDISFRPFDLSASDCDPPPTAIPFRHLTCFRCTDIEILEDTPSSHDAFIRNIASLLSTAPIKTLELKAMQDDDFADVWHACPHRYGDLLYNDTNADGYISHFFSRSIGGDCPATADETLTGTRPSIFSEIARHRRDPTNQGGWKALRAIVLDLEILYCVKRDDMINELASMGVCIVYGKLRDWSDPWESLYPSDDHWDTFLLP